MTDSHHMQDERSHALRPESFEEGTNDQEAGDAPKHPLRLQVPRLPRPRSRQLHLFNLRTKE